MAARKVTIVDVARAAGTSVSSASVAMRGDPGVSETTRAHILRTAERLGYRPDQRARRLREQHTRMLGVTFRVGQSFHAEVLENLYRAVGNTGYDLVLSARTAERSETDAVESLLADRCSALILVSPEISALDLAAVRRRAPVVTIGSDLLAPGVDSVRADDRDGVRAGVAHLVELGHRDITYVDSPGAVLAGERREGYLEAMKRHDLAPRVLTGGSDEESGIAVATRLLEHGPLPTGLLAHNDMTAFGVLLTMRARGVDVPGRLSIVGFDDTRLAGLRGVDLTSVSQGAAALAATAIRRAVGRAEDLDEPSREFVTPAHLVVRGTTGPS
ncbi:LacI family DNA-binding transcriptional regulator [Pseudonocardia xishanensis]|uniref:LacI family DNA-binding transcriptional regulator n=1 Tax=Pseudonocardia xishanensis TaxID=630995 RepID=A0ABP8RWZ1_9PSEU